MRRLASLALAVVAAPALAGPYDGLYRPDHPAAEGWDCTSVGMDGGALAIRDGRFEGLENACDLTNPVQVRGMQATLFDAVCMGEGMRDEYRMMLLKTDIGVTVISQGYANALRRCE